MNTTLCDSDARVTVLPLALRPRYTRVRSIAPSSLIIRYRYPCIPWKGLALNVRHHHVLAVARAPTAASFGRARGR